ncbi:MAG: transposase [Bacteroidia bacterium]|nr:transposase [Bacteroidia bacterium]
MESITLIDAILSKMSDVSKWQKSFFTHIICLFMQIKGRINFMQMGRYGKFNESTYRMNFARHFDFQEFNRNLIELKGSGHYVIAFDPSHIRKSGSSSFGRGKFWSGCDGAVKAGLELGGFAVCDIDNRTALHLVAYQSPNPSELKTQGQTLLDYYASLWVSEGKNLEKLSAYGCVDAYFAKYNFIEEVCSKTTMHLISRLRDDAHLKYLYQGKASGKPGRPKQYAGKIDIENPDLDYFELAYQDEKIRIYGAVVYAKALKRKVKLALTQHKDQKGKVKKTKLYFCTHLDISAWYIVKYYQNRFQIEFLYRDANQFTGLEHVQARDKDKLHFHFNIALTSVSVMKAAHYLNLPKEDRTSFSMASLKVLYHNELLLNKFFEAFAIEPKQHLNKPQIKATPQFWSF